MPTTQFVEGANISVFEAGLEIDAGVVTTFTSEGRGGVPEITVASTRLYPGTKTRFAFLEATGRRSQGWRVLFEDPMTGQVCFSQRAQAYDLRSA